MAQTSARPPFPDRASEFFAHLGRLATPGPIRRAKGRRLVESLGPELPAPIRERLDTYNRLNAPFVVSSSADSLPLKRLSSQSQYWFDLATSLRRLPRGLRLAYRFGDDTTPPTDPTIVKARRIDEATGTSVLLKLNKQRHYRFVEDSTPHRAKLPQIVWRGKGHQEHRRQIVEHWFDHPRCDFGRTDSLPDVARWHRGFLSVPEQLRFRFVLSLEGYDVATNLKWVFSSNSVCVMPRPTKETWFMEGRLQPGVHYVEVRPDLADLDQVLERWTEDVEGAEQIVRNANGWAEPFRDTRTESALELLVLQRYFWFAGQLGEEALAPALVEYERARVAAAAPPTSSVSERGPIDMSRAGG